MTDVYISKKKARAGHPKILARAFTAFAHSPGNISFENQEKNERVELFLRQHIITNVPWALAAVLMLLAPFLLRFFPFLGFMPGSFQLIIVISWYLLTAAFILENLLSWFFNIYIVTDRRIVDVDFHNLIYREVSDANLERVQDVTVKMGGATRAVFNYGDIFIQTAGAAPNFDFLAVPRPDEVARILQELRKGKHARV